MATQYGQGLTSVELSDIESDGSLGTDFSALGNTVQGSMQLVTEEGTTTNFNIEEQDDPILTTFVKGASTLQWECFDVSADMLYRLFGGTKTEGKIKTLGTITPGSSYTNGSYTNVALTDSGAGSGATANITVAGGVVTAVTIVNPGSGYAVNDALSANAADIGGTGSGFSVPVATIFETWAAPNKIEAVEQSVKITAASGQIIEIVRASIFPTFNWSFTKDQLARIAIRATVLTPTDEDSAPFYVHDAAA